jgi:hypothetical protein
MSIYTGNKMSLFACSENFPARVPLSSIGNDCDDILLLYKYLFGVRGVAPKDYTIAHNSVDVSKKDYF